jgi:hypothetical protein
VVVPAIIDRAGTGRDVPLSTDPAVPSVSPAVIAFTYRSGDRAPANGPTRFGIEGPLRLTLGVDGTGILRGPMVPASSFNYTVTGFSIAIGLWSIPGARAIGPEYALGGREGEMRFSLIHDPSMTRVPHADGPSSAGRVTTLGRRFPRRRRTP